MIYHVGISGGKDSAATLLWLVKESGIEPSRIRASFCDTGNEALETYEYVQMLSLKVHPIETIKPPLDFYELATKKGCFPSTKVRFCTEHLKREPTKNHIAYLQRSNYVMLVTGVRADESPQRRKLREFDYDAVFRACVWRPILKWTFQNVTDILRKYDVPMNPLYKKGARRVGCFPCINSNKAEIAMIARDYPERIEFLKQKEESLGKTFFCPNKTPQKYNTHTWANPKTGKTHSVVSIDGVARWALNGLEQTLIFEGFEELDDRDDYACSAHSAVMCE
jgi:3'-phosphoadenosine 5'-phosphosulfate sulfotransferase (PAPS reductase)/FAD synthetase